MARFVWCLGLAGCWFVPREVEISEVELVEAGRAVPAPVPPICDPDALTRAARTSDAVAQPLRDEARVPRAVCRGDFAYGLVQLGEGVEAAPALFLHRSSGWTTHDLGTGLDCAEPAPPLTPELCRELEKAWAAQGG